jgi:hypothetical protein
MTEDIPLGLERSRQAILIGPFLLGLCASVAAQMIGIETPAGVSSSVVFESSNLPIIKIQTDGLDIPYDPRIIAEMSVIDNGPGARNHVVRVIMSTIRPPILRGGYPLRYGERYPGNFPRNHML